MPRPAFASRRAVQVLTVAAAVAARSSAPADSGATSPGGSARPSFDRAVAPLEPSLTVSDPTDQTITVTKPPQRIVCLNGLCGDIVAMLGLTPTCTSNPALIKHPALFGDRAGASVPVVPARSAARRSRPSRQRGRTW